MGPDLNVFLVHLLLCRVALGAGGDRSIRTPTSGVPASAPQLVDQAEEDWLVWIPRQQAIDELSASTDNLTGQPHEGIDEALELQPQDPTFLRLVFFLVPS